jgi:cyclohexyl-isocyanide hydratase
MVMFPNMTQLDLTGPHEVLARMPDAEVHLIAANKRPVISERGLSIVPTTTFDDAPALDILFVPGGPGVNAMMESDALLEFLRVKSEHARYVTSVCTGALLLGAAGLLRGYRATTHWLSLDVLSLFCAIPVKERVVIDRNRITGGGVTAGIDFSLVVARELFGAAVAEEIQLLLEYDPQPPFQSGSSDTAPRDIVAKVTAARDRIQTERLAIAKRAAARLTKLSG